MSSPASAAGGIDGVVPAAGPSGEVDDLRLAQLHLRLGQLALARAELEDLAIHAALDTDGLASLAEARWRTNAAEAAAEAARAHLAAGGADGVAICIAAEAAAAAGDGQAARDLMARLGGLDPAQIDNLFAGMPQRAAWPVAADAAVEAADAAALGSGAAPAGELGSDRTRRTRAARDAATELRRAREELASRPERALVRLALVLRLDPTLAPAVLDAVALRREPTAALVRGDAQRLLGRHLEAEAAFDAAADSLEAS
ncbi:MAG TPA: hypothetical protein VK831_00180 [Candidatus Deferrimicrobiaceae bacterium]|nr:hypothetical protein [Candidatus Deferrimicrobiaceae bacterium]